VTFPTSTLRIIEDHGFYDCYSLTNIIIPEGVTRIGEWAFGYNNNNWVGVAKVKLPSTITSIGNYAFCGIRNFSSVVSRIASPFEIDRSVFCSDYYWEGEDYVYTPSSATLCVPDDTKAKYEAFSGWKMFAEIVEGELLEAKVDSFTYSYIKGKGAATLIGHAYSETRNITIPGSVKIGDDSYAIYYMHCACLMVFTRLMKFEYIKILPIYRLLELLFAVLICQIAIFIIRKLFKSRKIQMIFGV
jgi:hypothetical protein